jgi:hypothetical protein
MPAMHTAQRVAAEGLGRTTLGAVTGPGPSARMMRPDDARREEAVNLRPLLLLVAGYPGVDARVPDIRRKPLSEIATLLLP